jgi:ribonuclease HII
VAEKSTLNEQLSLFSTSSEAENSEKFPSKNPEREVSKVGSEKSTLNNSISDVKSTLNNSIANVKSTLNNSISGEKSNSIQPKTSKKATPKNKKTDIFYKKLFEYDTEIRREYAVICGVDEAGRGPLAGDVYAAACVLSPETVIKGLNDSKKLTEIQRDELFDEICEKAISYSIATATVAEIEEINILQATLLAMKRAVEGLKLTPNIALIDGNRLPNLPITAKMIIKGDGTSASIAAASILAKVARDRYMAEISRQYPQYCFEKHKGYGTKLHYEKLREFGISAVHRKSFLKNL